MSTPSRLPALFCLAATLTAALGWIPAHGQDGNGALFARADAGLSGVFGGAVSIADVDADGSEDLLIVGEEAGADVTATLYLGSGDGSFEATAPGLTAITLGSTSIADVDGDGNKDVLVTGGDENGTPTATLYLGSGDGSFEQAGAGLTGVEQSASTIADVDGDGNEDLLITGRNESGDVTATLYLGNGDGSFTEAGAGLTGVQNSSVSVGDVDGDENQDLLITGISFAGFTATLYLGAGNGTFEEAEANLTGVTGGSTSIADVDGDGNEDLLVTGSSANGASATLYLGRGDGTFEEAGAGLTGVERSSTAIAEVDGDGTQDLLITGLTEDDNHTATLYLGGGDGTFEEAGAGLNGVTASASAVADVDGDGTQDLLITGGDESGPTATLYLNETTLLASATRTVSGDGTVGFGETGTEIAFSGTSGSGDVTVEKFGDGPSGTDGIDEANVSSYRFVIEAGGDLSFDESTEVRLTTGSLSGIDDPTSVTAYQRSEVGAGTFSERSTSYDSGGDQLVIETGSFSEFVLASDSDPLPVEMAGFDGTATGGGVRLTWQTATETNNSGFDVQRRAEVSSGQGSSWSTVGFVEGAGTSSEPRSYEFTDTDLPYDADRLSYRLRQVDTDGTTTLSDPVTIERGVDTAELLGTFPNPASQQATVRYALPGQQDVQIRLYDALGRQVRTIADGRKEGRHEETIDVSGLSSGTYFLQLQAEGQAKTRQLTVTR